MEDTLEILGLTPAENKTLSTLLQGGTQSVSAIARGAILPRMTVHACLQRLHKRGMVRHEESGYRSLWKASGREKIHKEMLGSLSYLDSKLSRGELAQRIGVKISESTEFFVFKGIENMVKIYLWFILNNHGQRIQGIQPNLSSETIGNKLTMEKMAQINGAVKDNRVIIEAILPESVKDIYKNMAQTQLEVLKSVENRTTAVHLVPDSLLNFNADLLLARNVAIFSNWKEEVLVLIKNADFVKMLKNLHELLAQVGKSFDQNAYIRSLIEEREKTL